MHRLLEKSGEAPYDSQVVSTLSQPIDDSYVDVRPDGLIYVSHVHYRTRLDAAFGVGGWCLVPLAEPKIRGNEITYWGFLKAHGRFIADAHGEAMYYPQNKQGSYGKSVESAKSDCLVRCCKLLPMFRECWDREYADYWLSQYAEQGVTRQSQGVKVWKKKGAAMRDFTMRPDRQGESEYHKPMRVEDEALAHLTAIRDDRYPQAKIVQPPPELVIFDDDGRDE